MCHYYDKVVIISLSVLKDWKGGKKKKNSKYMEKNANL